MNVVPNAGSIVVTDSCPPAELVVQNGRMKGARRTLSGPLTLVGQGHGCEVRLNVDGVKPLHCVIVNSLDGHVIRDLAGDGTTLVNGQRVLGAQPLKDRDVIFIGPFQFLIEIPIGARPENLQPMGTATPSERDALRIQAAAVAAQQAGLTEEELRLEQRRSALQKQEEQLAARLGDRQAELREREEQFRQEQATFESSHQAEEQRLAHARGELERSRTEQETLRRKLADERQQLASLRQRFERRCQQHWNRRKVDFQQREAGLAALQSQIQKETEKLELERGKITEVHLRFNSEMEVGRRQLQEEWQKLSAAQQQWEDTATRNYEDLSRRQQAVEERENALAQAEQQLQQRRKYAEQHQVGLAVPAGSTANSSAVVLYAAGTPERQGLISEGLKRIGALVADQRWHLLEQWQRLLQVQCTWERERLAALAELDSAGQHLHQREQLVEDRSSQLQLREQILETRLTQLEQRQQSLSQLRCSLEGWQARMQLQATTWAAEREEVLNRARSREEASAAHLVRIEGVYRQRLLRLKKAGGEMRKAHLRSEQVRKQYITLWRTCQQQHQTLLTEQHNVTRQTLALERFRMECLSQCSDPAAAEKRLERLQRGGNALSTEALHQIERDRESLTAELNRVEERAQTLAELEQTLVQRSDAVARQVAELENQRLSLTEADARRAQEIQRAQTQQRLAEQQVEELREEVERLARMLLDESDASSPVSSRQAA